MTTEIRLDNLYNLMIKDMLESEPPFLSESWPTTGKISRKLTDVFTDLTKVKNSLKTFHRTP